MIGTIEELSTTPHSLTLVRSQLETNFFGPVNMIRASLPSMREHRSGHIIVLTGISMSSCSSSSCQHEASRTSELLGLTLCSKSPRHSRLGNLLRVRMGFGRIRRRKSELSLVPILFTLCTIAVPICHVGQPILLPLVTYRCTVRRIHRALALPFVPGHDMNRIGFISLWPRAALIMPEAQVS